MLAIIGAILLAVGVLAVLGIVGTAAPRAAALVIRKSARSREALVKERILLDRILRVAR